MAFMDYTHKLCHVHSHLNHTSEHTLLITHTPEHNRLQTVFRTSIPHPHCKVILVVYLSELAKHWFSCIAISMFCFLIFFLLCSAHSLWIWIDACCLPDLLPVFFFRSQFLNSLDLFASLLKKKQNFKVHLYWPLPPSHDATKIIII